MSFNLMAKDAVTDQACKLNTSYLVLFNTNSGQVAGTAISSVKGRS